MPALVLANAAILRLIWANGGAPYAVNVFGAINSGGTNVTQSAVNNIGAAIKGALTSSGVVGALGNTISLQTVTLRNINTPNQGELQDVTAPVTGTSAAGLLPPQTALCVTLRTALAGRSYRGRCYLPGFAEDCNDVGGTASAAVGAAAATFVNAIATAMSAQSLPMAVLSRTVYDEEGNVVRLGFATPVTLAVTRNLVWDTQRRRAIPGI